MVPSIELAILMERAPLIRPMSRMQEVVCVLLGLGLTYGEAAEHLLIAPDMVREHTKRAAAKIPGDLPAQMRCIAWARGATLDVLLGQGLRGEALSSYRSARGGRKPPQGGGVARSPVGA